MRRLPAALIRRRRVRVHHLGDAGPCPVVPSLPGISLRRLLVALLLLAGILTPLLPAIPAVAAETPGVRALDWAETHAAGCWYSWGGTGPCSRGYDCSGLVMSAVLHADGIMLPRTTYAMPGSRHLYRVTSPRRGDLAFFGAGHVEFWVQPDVTFGAHHTGTRTGYRTYNGWYHPTAYYRLR